MLSGFIVIDKPAGITSHDVVAEARRLLCQKKIGHTGTLDPFATGVLPIALGEATKAIPFLDEAQKKYTAVMRLGIATDTQDLTGTIIMEKDWRNVSEEMIHSLVSRFTGKLTQLPPMFSALKRDGVPLYKLARKGETIARAERDIEIRVLSIDKIDRPDVTFSVCCSRGTYIRTLASDMGEYLGSGAHLRQLQRTASGPFSLDSSISMEQLRQSVLQGTCNSSIISVRESLGNFGEIHLNEVGFKRIRNGISPEGSDVVEPLAEPFPGQKVLILYQDQVTAIGEGMQAAMRVNGKFLRLIRVFNQLCPLH